MRVLVLGAGVIGITTAYYLAENGHEVTVIERQPGVGREASYANGGNVCPSYATPWAAPGMRKKVLGWLREEDAPLKVTWRLEPDFLAWVLRWTVQCSPARFAVNKPRMQRISRYSLRCLQTLREDLALHYDQTTQGILQLLRTNAELDAIHAHTAILAKARIPHQLLDAGGCLAIEPALAFARLRFMGGLHLPSDETGDCHLFTQALAEHASRLGVRFRFETSVNALVKKGNRIAGVETSLGLLQADSYVMALGWEAARLLRSVGIRVPIQPVKGYSVTLPITAYEHAPRASVIDEHSKITIARLGNRVRAAGTAELGAHDVDTPAERFEPLLAILRGLYPDAADESRADFWAGMRPMTPDGPPILGASPLHNLFLNIGHGSQGWSMACGSGRVVAQLVSRRDPGLDLSGLTLERYQ